MGPPSLHTSGTHRLCLPQQQPRSHYSSSHRPNHESSFSKMETKMKNASKATQWLCRVGACNVICHSLSSHWCDYGMGYGLPCHTRWWPLIGEAGQEPGSAQPLQSVTLDPGILHPQHLCRCWGTVEVYLPAHLCVSERDIMALAVPRVLSFLFLLHTNTRNTHKSVCIRYLLYYCCLTDTRRCNRAGLCSSLCYCLANHLCCILFLHFFFIYSLYAR